MTFWAGGTFAVGSVHLQTSYDGGVTWVDVITAVTAPTAPPVTVAGPYPLIRATTDAGMTGTVSAYLEPFQ